jgi:hypothetical protein
MLRVTIPDYTIDRNPWASKRGILSVIGQMVQTRTANLKIDMADKKPAAIKTEKYWISRAIGSGCRTTVA